jgi:PTS system nitrogen regulatory IIA component
MNPVGELLGVEDVEVNLDVSGKDALLQRIAAMLAQRRHLVPSEVLDSLIAREQLGSTAVGHGMAIPHARMSQCGASAAVFVRTRAGIPFDAPDGRPVSIFLGMIVPQQANERHLKLLATAAAMFSDRAFREKLRATTDAALTRDLLAAWPEMPALGARDKPTD